MRLAHGADLGGGQLAVLEQHQRRDPAHRVLARDLGIVVDVDLHDLDLAGMGRGDLVHDRPDHLAGPAPLGPEVDHDGDLLRALQDLRLEEEADSLRDQIATAKGTRRLKAIKRLKIVTAFNRRDDHNRRSQLYHDMPSVTPRAWGPMPPDDDSFGPRSLGGYGDFRTRAESRSRREQDARAQDRPRGGQRGRGPRNEVRPDASIADDIYQRLTDDEELDASEILLSVEDGFVTLTGEVPEKAMKRRAEDIAAQAWGVRDIRNCIHYDDGSASFGPAGRAVPDFGSPAAPRSDVCGAYP